MTDVSSLTPRRYDTAFAHRPNGKAQPRHRKHSQPKTQRQRRGGVGCSALLGCTVETLSSIALALAQLCLSVGIQRLQLLELSAAEK